MSPSRKRARGAMPMAAGVVVSASFLVCGSVMPALADDEVVVDRGAASAAEAGSWQSVDDSVSAAPSDLAAKVDANDRARVVALRDEDGVPTFDVKNVKGRAQAEAVVAEVQARDETLAVAVEEKKKLISSSAADATATNDPYWGSAWGLTRLGAEGAWQVASGAGQTVAIVDTGSAAEPDLAPQLLTGWDFVADREGGQSDQNGHGTHVAGIVAATAGNAIGASGLAPAAKILPVRALDSAGQGYWSDIASGIIYAVNQGAGVINLSLGGHADDPNLKAAVDYATSNGRTVVAAVGNDGSGALTYPAAYPGVIGVSATNQSDGIASFSNFGSAVDVAAPGVGILSTVPGGYASMSGTSMAAPFVSASAALIRSAAVSHGLGAVNVEAALKSTAIDLGAPGRDVYSGSGRVNPRDAMCGSGACAVGLNPTATLKKQKLTVRLNRAAVQQVVLQKKVGKVWKRVTVKLTATNGVVSFKVKRGTSYRYVIPTTTDTLMVKSKSIRAR